MQNGFVVEHHYINAAVTTYDGNITFISDSKRHTGGAGATISEDSMSATGMRYQVNATDILTLLRQARIRQNNFVVVQLDIEGAEYDVLWRLLLSRYIHFINRIAVEWHHTNFWAFGKPDKPPALKYKQHYDSIMWMLGDSSDLAEKIVDWER